MSMRQVALYAACDRLRDAAPAKPSTPATSRSHPFRKTSVRLPVHRSFNLRGETEPNARYPARPSPPVAARSRVRL